MRSSAQLGAGGMGEVYRARDTKLHRDVALKVLPAGAIADPAAKARLLREARLAASLNHPSICTVHDVDESDGRLYRDGNGRWPSARRPDRQSRPPVRPGASLRRTPRSPQRCVVPGCVLYEMARVIGHFAARAASISPRRFFAIHRRPFPGMSDRASPRWSNSVSKRSRPVDISDGAQVRAALGAVRAASAVDRVARRESPRVASLVRCRGGSVLVVAAVVVGVIARSEWRGRRSDLRRRHPVAGGAAAGKSLRRRLAEYLADGSPRS